MTDDSWKLETLPDGSPSVIPSGETTPAPPASRAPKRKRCRRAEHDWHLVRNGLRQECKTCKDSFPCRGECDHLDCRDARAEAPTNPKWTENY